MYMIITYIHLEVCLTTSRTKFYLRNCATVNSYWLVELRTGRKQLLCRLQSDRKPDHLIQKLKEAA